MELGYELRDIFKCGTFAFPIYDHNSARRIVYYLMRRGIIAEEIAEAIEDSTTDLNMWMNKHGKHKIGEWVIAWINDMREEFDRGELHGMREDEGSEFDHDLFMSIGSPESDDGHHSDDEGRGNGAEEDRCSDSRITDLESTSSQAASRASADIIDTIEDSGNKTTQHTCDIDVNDEITEAFPLPVTHRTLTTNVMTLDKLDQPYDIDQILTVTLSNEGFHFQAMMLLSPLFT